jgi:hypothetical protein
MQIYRSPRRMSALACKQIAYLHGFSFFISSEDISPLMVKSL